LVNARDGGLFGVACEKYMNQKLGEMVSGVVQDNFSTPEMEWGIEQEPFAIEAYSKASGNAVEQYGFVRHASGKCGASPDGVIGDSGLVEVKSRYKIEIHIATLLSGKVSDKKHYWQMQGQMLCMNREWCDYVSWCPFVEEDLRLKIIRVERNQEDIDKLTERIDLCWERNQQYYKTLKVA
jgi:hypothetical protein